MDRLRCPRPSVPIRRPAASALVVAAAAAFVLLAACSREPDADAANLLVVVLDDVGVDKLAVYLDRPELRTPNTPRTPVLDGLAARGVVFRNAWSSPTCSPTRASILTGLRPEITGIGEALPPGPGLDPDLPTIADVASANGRATAAIGKWHLSGRKQHPLEVGFDAHRGTRANIGPGGYVGWRKLVDGTDVGRQTRYATTAAADDAIDWIAGQGGPWLVWLAFHAPHRPLHVPPIELHSRPGLDRERSSPAALYAAMLEAVDHELGRVLAAAGDGTTVVVVGDNGTYGAAIEPPFDAERGKHSIHESGIRVPLIVAGPAVSEANRGRASDVLVQVTDLFATLAELVGSPATTGDSRSLAPQLRDVAAPGRTIAYTSGFKPNGGPPRAGDYVRAARDARFKLVREGIPGRQALYDLLADPFERDDLLRSDLPAAARVALPTLAAAIDANEWPGVASGEPAPARLPASPR